MRLWHQGSGYSGIRTEPGMRAVGLRTTGMSALEDHGHVGSRHEDCRHDGSRHKARGHDM